MDPLTYSLNEEVEMLRAHVKAHERAWEQVLMLVEVGKGRPRKNEILMEIGVVAENALKL